ncbi:MAG: HalD/BesD family halogenase [Acidimicrobiales bacterium]
MESSQQLDVLDPIIDLDRYPIHRLDDPVRHELVAETRSQMDALGCCRISDFIRPDAIDNMKAEAQSLHEQTFWAEQSHNPYASKPDRTLPDQHPRNVFQERRSGFINADLLPGESLLNLIYAHNVFTHFVWESLGTPRPIYQWADPLGCNPYGVMSTDNYFPWHFDGNEFTVSILVQKAESGGVFEYVPDIRRPDAENFERVQAILEGGREEVHELDLLPGDLQLFKGRFSMHRVTRIVGPTTRYIALPTYVYDPWRMNRPHHSINYYGRATALHYERERVLVDGLVD